MFTNLQRAFAAWTARPLFSQYNVKVPSHFNCFRCAQVHSIGLQSALNIQTLT
jgi:hypothetical protein